MKKHVPWLLLLACGALIGSTFYLLLRDRFESGDVYPPSSSLRSDPLGTMILFESLQALPGLTVDQDHAAFNRLPAGNRTAYLHLAGEASDWRWISADLDQEIDRFLREGGRLVVTFKPEYGEVESAAAAKKDAADSEKATPRPTPTASPDEADEPDRDLIDLEEKWGVTFFEAPASGGKREVTRVSDESLPLKLKWNGDLVLKDPDATWTVIYQNEKGPVIAEKALGLGSVVIATDSYFVSNEALVRDRHPELLAWLIGSADRVVFDEAHLGIVESPGIAALARKYRLHGGVLALLILAGLFIWKNASPLAPSPTTAARTNDLVAGRSAGSGFVNLLKRNISSDQIFPVCLEEWRKSFSHGDRHSAGEKAAVEEIAREEAAKPIRERDLVAAYQKIRSALHRIFT